MNICLDDANTGALTKRGHRSVSDNRLPRLWPNASKNRIHRQRLNIAGLLLCCKQTKCHIVQTLRYQSDTAAVFMPTPFEESVDNRHWSNMLIESLIRTRGDIGAVRVAGAEDWGRIHSPCSGDPDLARAKSNNLLDSKYPRAPSFKTSQQA